MTIADVFASWKKDLPEYGIADYLRCVAMSASELGLARDVYVAEAGRLGFNEGTAARCWAYVGKQ